MNTLKVYVFIPYNSLGDVQLNDVKVFDSYPDIHTLKELIGFSAYDIVETNLNSYLVNNGDGSGFRG
jgi:hypothetical protein